MASAEQVAVLRRGVEAWNGFRAASPEARPDLRGAEAGGLGLAGVQLAGADLRGADLTGTDLADADLRGADLVDCCLRSTNLGGADLKGADLSRADLAGAKLGGARLEGAILEGASLANADLHGAELTKANLRRARFGYANLAQADLAGANLTESELLLTDLREANLEGVCLRDATVVRCTLDHARLQSSDLVFARFRGCSLVAAILWYADLSRATLDGCELRGAALAGATMVGTVLVNLDLGEVKGLDSVRHDGPSCLGLESLTRTAAAMGRNQARGVRLEPFLRGVGASDELIATFRRLVVSPPPPPFCFLSFDPSDRQTVRRVFDRLQARGARCWRDEHRLLPGEDICDRVDRQLRPGDRVLLVISRASLASWWLADEVAKTLAWESELAARGRGEPTLLVLDLDGATAATTADTSLLRTLRERVVARLSSGDGGGEDELLSLLAWLGVGSSS